MAQGIPLIVGVDGGGTSCRAAAMLPDGRRVEARGGPANVSRFDVAIANLRMVLDALAGQAGVRDLRHARVHLGLAGVVTPEIGARVAAALPLAAPVVTDDQPTTIAGALGVAAGAVAAVGTGSFVGRQSGGAIRALGGWGHVLGDQASGAWLGKRLLEAALLAGDGLVAQGDLSRAISARLGGAPGIVSFGFGATPDAFAALAPDVLAAASAGDPLGRGLMDKGARYLMRALAALGWQPHEPLVLTGGLGSAYAGYLPPEARAALVAPLGTALDGALALAGRASAGGTA